ncbi:hypothetical protein GGX14DRAFT_507174 [Mycena pura]|uniref:DUF6593 domain-containing protein n=1 Tax=Mycena pura TaxID=153505 RepID=A0AAD6UM84_9AGAR|nr:hypothetical protein GGX14DRAFT_507174 [Mycena pura]
MTRYGMPYILEDTTGRLADADFADIHDRLHFSVRSTTRDTYVVYNRLGHVVPLPLVVLAFGADGAPGTVSFAGAAAPLPMARYLLAPPHAGSGGSGVRSFVAADGQTYQWAHRVQPNQEWTCTNANGYVIASYSLKAAGEPEYRGSSGCILEIAEQFGALAPEILASLLIMRHIAMQEL